MLIDAVWQDDELPGIRVEDRARNAHRVAGTVRIVTERRGLRAAASDVLLRVGLGVVAVLRPSIRRDVAIERRLPGRRELGEVEAIATLATVTTTPAAAESVGVR